MGIGAQETVIILVIVVVLFGAPILTFFFGYMLGRRQGADRSAQSSSPQAPIPPQETPDE
jgi:Sec-independent protein translocase protein TatA